MRGGSLLSFACGFTHRHFQKLWLDALESYEQALEVKKKNPDEKYFFIVKKIDVEKIRAILLDFLCISSNSYSKST